MAQRVKNPPAMQETQETWVRSLSWEDALEKGMATHCSILAWRIPQTEEPGGLQPTELQRVRHHWATFTLPTYMNLDSVLKSRDITLSTKVHLVKAMVFPVVMYGCESWTKRKLSAEELMLLNCGVGQLLRVPWTARRSNQSILKEISPGDRKSVV